VPPEKSLPYSTLTANLFGEIAGYFLCLMFFVFYPLSTVFAAEGTRPTYTPPPPAVGSGNIVQIIFSLFLVLVAIVVVAWLLKRMNITQQGSGKLLKVVGGVAIGHRERIVLVEVQDTWLVVGVGPGQVRTLHTIQKPIANQHASDNSTLTTQPSDNKFSNLLAAFIRPHPSDRKKDAP